MSKKRKKKKEEKKSLQKAKPNTSVGEAMTKAKKTNGVKPRKISGFGYKESKKSQKTPLVHAVSDTNDSALCDSRIKDIPVFAALSADKVTCKKCRGLASVKVLLTVKEKQNGKPVVKEKPKKKKVHVVKKQTATEIKETLKKSKAKVTPKKTEVEPPENKTDDSLDEISDGILEHVKTVLAVKLKKMETRMIKKLENYCDKILEAKPLFFLSRKANNMYQIIHGASRYVIIENIKESEADELLPKFMEIEAKWDGQSNPPKDWLSSIRKICELAKGKREKSTKRVLARRNKPSLKKRKDRVEPIRKIKRRQK